MPWRRLATFLPLTIAFALVPVVSHAAFTTSITSDGTLPTPTSVIQAVNVYNINGGTIRGSNLFHSFGLFSVGTGDIANFNGPSGIRNILSRVTGGQQSIIDGQIRSTILGANLYLMNPAGLVFGPNATLNVSGSFHVTTADYLRLTDGVRFTAIPGTQDALLSTAPVAAFGFLSSTPAPLAIIGSTLTVSPGQTLSLIGGDIAIVASSLSAPSGIIQMASVASAGEVIPSVPGGVPDLHVDSFTRLGRIEISAGSSLDARGDPGGAVVIRGGQLLVDSASLSVITLGAADGTSPGIDIRVTDDILITNGASMLTLTLGDGQGSDLSVAANTFSLMDGSQIISSSGVLVSGFTLGGTGQGGKVKITANDALLVKDALITTTAVGSGQGGDIEVNGRQVTLIDGAQVISFANADGAGGRVIVTATDSLAISGQSSSGLPSGMSSQARGSGNAGQVFLSAPTAAVILADAGQIASTTEGTGGAGDIVVEARSLTMNGGAQIFNDNFGNGPTGSVSVTAKESIAISGSRSNGLPSAVTIFASGGGDPGQLSVSAPTIVLDGGIIGAPAIPNGLGRAGDITVVSGALTLTNGGRIDSTTFTDKPGGIVTVIATDSVSISGHSPSGLLSGIVSGTTGAGNAGTIVLSAPTASVILSDDALIGVSTLGSGSAGSIEVNVGTLTLGSGAQISSATFGTGVGGVVTVTTKDSITISGRDSLGNPSGFFTNTGGTGHGGNIELHAGQIQLTDGATISAKSFGIANAGNISVTLSDRLVLRDSAITTEALQADGGNITIRAGEVVQLINTSITTSVGTGSGNGGNITIDPQFVILQSGSQILANAFGGNGGNIQITAGLLLISPDSVISASSALGVSGTITIDSAISDLSGSLTPLPQGFLRKGVLLSSRCAARLGGSNSSFVVAGREAIPMAPGGLLPSPLYGAGEMETVARSPGEGYLVALNLGTEIIEEACVK